MDVWINGHVEVDVDDIISQLTSKERKELFDDLKSEFGNEASSLEEKIATTDVILGKQFHNLSVWEMKKLLCNALGVGSYYDEQALRKALEPIIKAL